MQTLRPYQDAAIAAIYRELANVRATLLVVATGGGKTKIFSTIARDWDDRRVLVLAHRDELLSQARARLEAETGEHVDLEQAQSASYSARIVVGSVQSLHAKRLQRFNPDTFGLIVADECHRAVGKSWRTILDYFPTAKVLGVTATPDRTDGAAMGQVFDSVAFRYDIADGIRDGYLVPVIAKKVVIDGLQLDNVKTTAGDLNSGELDAEMARHVHSVAKPLVEGDVAALVGNRRTLVFASGITTSRAIAAALNGYRPGCARFIDSQLEMPERREILRGHKRDDFQFLINVGVLTEGYDDPAVSCVAVARPTKSRLLFTQMAGRGTRTAPGKQDLLLLHFTGETTRHRLACPADILGGKWPQEVVDRAGDVDGNVEEALKKTAEEMEREKVLREREAEMRRLEAARRAVKMRVRAEDVSVWGGWMGNDPSGVLAEPATDEQMTWLKKRYATSKKPIPDGISKTQAQRLIAETMRRQKNGLVSLPQADLLKRYGFPADMEWSKGKALIDAIATAGWRRPDAHIVDHILKGPDLRRRPWDDDR